MRDYHQFVAAYLTCLMAPVLWWIPEYNWLQDIGRMDSLPNIAGC